MDAEVRSFCGFHLPRCDLHGQRGLPGALEIFPGLFIDSSTRSNEMLLDSRPVFACNSSAPHRISIFFISSQLIESRCCAGRRVDQSETWSYRPPDEVGYIPGGEFSGIHAPPVLCLYLYGLYVLLIVAVSQIIFWPDLALGKHPPAGNLTARKSAEDGMK